MPVLRKYRDKNGYYILTSINKTMVTFQLTYRCGEFSIWRHTSQQGRPEPRLVPTRWSPQMFQRQVIWLGKQ